MVIFNAILNGLFSAVVGGILAGVGIQWLTYIIKERGPDVALGEAFAIYLGVIAGVVFGFIVGVICSPLMPFATYLKGIGVVVSGLVVLCALITGVRWLGEEREPRIQGKLVDFEFERQTPKGTAGRPRRRRSPLEKGISGRDRIDWMRSKSSRSPGGGPVAASSVISTGGGSAGVGTQLRGDGGERVRGAGGERAAKELDSVFGE